MIRTTRKHVFRNYYGTPTEHSVIRQSKPNVGTYTWQPQVPNIHMHRQQPTERGATFSDIGRSGLGTVGPRMGKVLTTSNAGDLAGITPGGQPGIASTTAGSLSTTAIMTRVRPGPGGLGAAIFARRR